MPSQPEEPSEQLQLASKRPHELAFSPLWLEMPRFQKWMLVKNGVAYCKFCRVTVTGNISHMHRHGQRARHLDLYALSYRRSGDLADALETVPSSDDDNDGGGGGGGGGIRKSSGLYTFRPRWLLRPELKRWMVQRNGRPFCKFCDTVVLGTITHMYRHGKSVKHMYNVVVWRKENNAIDEKWSYDDYKDEDHNDDYVPNDSLPE